MIDYPEPHWTDTAPRPVFTTVIRAVGPAGNINRILSEACALLAIIEVPADRCAPTLGRLRAMTRRSPTSSGGSRWSANDLPLRPPAVPLPTLRCLPDTEKNR